ncbi:MAG: FIST N-terminal domain-containing protein, partial [Alphaproteobacteria bacterium]
MNTIIRDFQVAFAADAGWREMTDACVADLDRLSPAANLGFVYMTDAVDETLRAVTARLREATRIQNWVGTIGFGICVAGKEMFDRPALAIMTAALPEDSFRVLPSVTSPDDRLPEDVLSWAREHEPMLGVVHADPRAPSLERVLHAIQKQTGCFLVGG